MNGSSAAGSSSSSAKTGSGAAPKGFGNDGREISGSLNSSSGCAGGASYFGGGAPPAKGFGSSGRAKGSFAGVADGGGSSLVQEQRASAKGRETAQGSGSGSGDDATADSAAMLGSITAEQLRDAGSLMELLPLKPGKTITIDKCNSMMDLAKVKWFEEDKPHVVVAWVFASLGFP